MPQNEPLYQIHPPYSRPTDHPRQHRWTDTIVAYQREAKQWSQCLHRSAIQQNIRYRWFATINIQEHLSPTEIQKQFNKTCKLLHSQNIVGFWSREINKNDLIHYHLIIQNKITKQELEQAIESSMPPRQSLRWRKRVERIDNEWHVVRYIVKAKVPGIVNGKPVDDLYKSKRLLFKPNLGLRKCGTIGNLWGNKSKAKIWAEICDHEKRIANGLAEPGIQDLCHAVYGMLDGVPLQTIERCFGYFADSESVQEWSQNLQELSHT